MNASQESDVIENVISTVECPTSRLFRIVSLESVLAVCIDWELCNPKLQ